VHVSVNLPSLFALNGDGKLQEDAASRRAVLPVVILMKSNFGLFRLALALSIDLTLSQLSALRGPSLLSRGGRPDHRILKRVDSSLLSRIERICTEII